MIIHHQGVAYDIQNWDEFSEKLLSAIGFQVEEEMLKEIQRQNLMGATGELFRSYKARVDKTNLFIESSAPHSAYIEYGTAGRKRGVKDPFGELNMPPNPSRKMPLSKKGSKFEVIEGLQKWAKIKGIPKEKYWALAKHIQEYGMEPRAPLRRVLYNKAKMEQIITKAVKSAGR